MSLPLILGCLWAILAGVTAMLPMKFQIGPGIVLLVSAPVLIVWIGRVEGPWITAFAVFAFASMFRKPLWYLARKALGLPVERPDAGERG